MRMFKPAIGIVLSVLLTWALDTKFGQLPPVARFMDPFHGVWQNAERPERLMDVPESLAGLRAGSRVVVDDRDVPHIFAENDHDLYFLQGYLTASHRLWQMETQTRAAAGRLSEVIGPSTLEFDLEQRRIGMTWAAEEALEAFSGDSVSRSVIDAYTAGINAYIATLDYRKLPVEYKLLDYRPEPWTPLKSSLLLKHMAKMLTGSERDFANTEALKLLGPELFAFLYPEQNRLKDPIVPGFAPDTSARSEGAQAFFGGGTWHTIDPQPSHIGSNNWAVAGARTANGNPILCNDPHLGLALPSIWYEVQLHAPGINCYGVSLPGAPGVVIGFNERIAWGVTNAGRDVKDYFSIEFEDRDKKRYRYGDQWRETSIRLEEIKVRGEKTVVDTVIYTHYGPIAHVSEDGNHLALRWSAHEPSNELMTFHGLNRAHGYEDYAEAIKHFGCPGQNFVFADVEGNIAIWQQGKFPKKPQGHGRFILNGADPLIDLRDHIPQQHNPHMVNPERGFVSSANQAPTDTLYPYYYTGVFEEFRNRTINDFLRNDSLATVESMMALQNSNYNMLAAEALPVMLNFLDTLEFQNKETEMLAVYLLLEWDYYHHAGIISPTIFQIWWDELNSLIYDELNDPKWDQSEYYRYSLEEFDRSGKAYLDLRDQRYVYPHARVTIDLLTKHPDHPIFDHHFTERKDNARQIVYDAFYWTAVKLKDLMDFNIAKPHWGRYQGTRVMHLMKLDAFSSPKLAVGGNKNAPNAMTSSHGPSWRMVVELTPDGPKAFGALPGGQSGNPGSHGYLRSLRHWVKGQYHELHLLKASDLDSGKWTVRTVSPAH